MTASVSRFENDAIELPLPALLPPALSLSSFQTSRIRQCSAVINSATGSEPLAQCSWGISFDAFGYFSLDNKKPAKSFDLAGSLNLSESIVGGEKGIRTLDTLPYTHFPGVRLRPLGHLSCYLSPTNRGKPARIIEIAFCCNDFYPASASSSSHL